MMIKKQLSVLAGSLVLAAGSHAAITAGTGQGGADSSVVLVLMNSAAGSYVFDVQGVTADAFALGTSFSVDISAAAGFAIENFAVFATQGCEADCAGTDYANAGLGVTYAGAAQAAIANGDLIPQVASLNEYFQKASAGGLFALNSPGDLQAEGVLLAFAGGSLSQTGIASVHDLRAGADSVEVNPNAPLAGSTATGLYQFDAGTFYFSQEETAVIPVPAAAWLFGSALLGLGVVRRKS